MKRTLGIFPNRQALLVVLLYLIATVWWIYMFISGSVDTVANNSYGLILGSIPVVGGICGIFISSKWGMFKSAVGKSLFFFALGLISWGSGTYIFSGYYNLFAKVEVPYPSVADLGYILAIPLWAIGLFYLANVTGAKFGIRTPLGKPLVVVLPIVSILVSYYLLVVVARGGVFDFSGSDAKKIIVDLLYPIGDVVLLTILTMVYGLSYKFFGGIFKYAIYVIFTGLVLMYVADFAFSYATTLGTFYVGDWIDFLFTTSMFILTLGIIFLDPRLLDNDTNALDNNPTTT